MAVAIGLGALIAALIPLWATWITVRGREEADYTRSIEQRLRDAETRLAACQREVDALTATVAELRSENIDLLRRLMKGEPS